MQSAQGFEIIEILGTSGKCSDLADVTTAAAHEGQRVQRIFEDNAELGVVDQAKCTKASREMHSALAGHDGSEAVTVVRSAIWERS